MRQFTKSKLSCSMLLVSMLSACGGSGDSNEAPVFNPESDLAQTLAEDTFVQGVISATDDSTAASALNFTVGSAASNGTFALEDDGNYTYTPDADFSGTDTVVVNVSDGDKQSSATLTFTVTNVNDVPMLSTSVAATDQTMTGKLLFTDIDGDGVTYTLETDLSSLQGTLVLHPTSGEFTYTTSGALDTQFTVSYTDGSITTALVKNIPLVSTYLTNENKVEYYYAAPQSHLNAAQAVSSELTGDVAINELTAELATGYVIASDDAKATELIESIAELTTQSEAYLNAADALQSKGDLAGAELLRKKAEIAYNIYVAQIGMANISKTDATFMYSLHGEYLDAGSSDLATAYAATLGVYAEEINTPKYSSTHAVFVNVFAFTALDRINNFTADPSSENYDLAVTAITDFAAMAQDIGYSTSSSNPYHKYRVNYLTQAANYFFRIGATDLAKDYTAKTFAYYGEANYDSNFVYPADETAALTLNKYPTGLTTLTGLFAALYPGEPNLPLALVEAEEGVGDSDYKNSLANQFAYEAFNEIKDGTDVATAVATINTHYAGTDLLTFNYQSLVEFYGSSRLGMVLLEQGLPTEAVAAYSEASDLLTSQVYLEAQVTNSTTTGFYGCLRLTQLTLAAGDDGLTQAAECQTMVNNYFQTPLTTKYSDKELRQAEYDLIFTHLVTGNSSPATIDPIVASLNAKLVTLESDVVTLDDQVEQAGNYLTLAGYLATFELFDDAKAAYTIAIAKLQTVVDDGAVDAEILEDVVDLLEKNVASYDLASTGTPNRESYLVALRQGAGTFAGYEDQITQTLAKLVTLTEVINTKAALLADNERQGLIENQVLVNLHAGLLSQADALINDSVNETVEQQELILAKGLFLAKQDAFPASRIASVDTDNDGMPDFFTLEATDAEIIVSGLMLDDDNDNDGVLNAEDITPLG